MNTPTEAEYNAAKQRQLDHPTQFSSSQPTPEVLADVATINAYELELGKAEAKAEAERRASEDG